MKETHLWPEPIHEKDGWITASATIERRGGRKNLLWYRLPCEYRDLLTEVCDPFVVAIQFIAMSERRSLRVHGRVSPSLLRNLEDFQTAWASWKSNLYGRVEILADDEAEATGYTGDRPSIMVFSGGVDSAFTAYRHVRGIGTRFPRKLEAGVMVHGFDVPLEEPETFDSAFKRSRRMMDSLGLLLIPMATNFRELGHEWSHAHGAAVASCMLLLAGGYSEGLIGQTVCYDNYENLTEGSNMLTDALLSSGAFRVLPDGGGYKRADKIRAMLDWPEFLQNLRVCWSGPQKDRNCCACEKCIRTILNFRALRQPNPPCFPVDVSDDQIRRLSGLKESTMRVQYENILRLARDYSKGESWVKVLELCLKRNRRRNSWNRSRAARVHYYLKRSAHYAVRPSDAIFRLKHGHPLDKPGKNS